MAYTDFDGGLRRSMQENMAYTEISMTGKYVADSIGDDYKSWNRKKPVFIDAPTGTRKTTFIYEQIIPYAIEQKKNVLLISNRIALNLQQKEAILKVVREKAPDSISKVPPNLTVKDMNQISYIGPVCVVTYQGLYSLLNTSNEHGQYDTEAWYRNLRFVIFDEIHFLYSDALFNSYCGSLLEKLPVVFSRMVRIYMTATSWEILDRIRAAEANIRSAINYLSFTPMEQYIIGRGGQYSDDHSIRPHFFHYHMDADYSSYRLHFFYDENAEEMEESDTVNMDRVLKDGEHPLIQNMSPLPSKTNKWLIFIDRKSLGVRLQSQLKAKGVSVAYIDAKKRTPKKVWSTLISESKIEESVLISTSVIQNGVNIVDDNVRNIAIFCTDRTSFIQELGRKRLKKDETVNLWVWVPSLTYFNKLIKKMQWHLIIANNLKLRATNVVQYANAVKSLWDKHSLISYHALYYVDNQGNFCVNQYAYETLLLQFDFIYHLAVYGNPLAFQSTVESWLGIKAIEPTQSTEISLEELFASNAGQKLSEAAFQPLRQAIVFMAHKKKVEYIAPSRRNSVSAAPLNRMLSSLNIPYSVKKNKKTWLISPTLPTE